MHLAADTAVFGSVAMAVDDNSAPAPKPDAMPIDGSPHRY